MFSLMSARNQFLKNTCTFRSSYWKGRQSHWTWLWLNKYIWVNTRKRNAKSWRDLTRYARKAVWILVAAELNIHSREDRWDCEVVLSRTTSAAACAAATAASAAAAVAMATVSACFLCSSVASLSISLSFNCDDGDVIAGNCFIFSLPKTHLLLLSLWNQSSKIWL